MILSMFLTRLDVRHPCAYTYYLKTKAFSGKRKLFIHWTRCLSPFQNIDLIRLPTPSQLLVSLHFCQMFFMPLSFKNAQALRTTNKMADLRLHAENGEFIIVLDDQDRENKADLIIAAESITPAQMAFLVRFSR